MTFLFALFFGLFQGKSQPYDSSKISFWKLLSILKAQCLKITHNISFEFFILHQFLSNWNDLSGNNVLQQVLIWAFSMNFCRLKIDLSSTTVFQKFTKIANYWLFSWTFCELKMEM